MKIEPKQIKAREVFDSYDDNGRPCGITFGLQTAQGGTLYQVYQSGQLLLGTGEERAKG